MTNWERVPPRWDEAPQKGQIMKMSIRKKSSTTSSFAMTILDLAENSLFSVKMMSMRHQHLSNQIMLPIQSLPTHCLIQLSKLYPPLRLTLYTGTATAVAIVLPRMRTDLFVGLFAEQPRILSGCFQYLINIVLDSLVVNSNIKKYCTETP